MCAAAINAQTIGRKAGFYGNDVWNARFLKGFSWADLMAGARAEEREREERVRVGLGREMRERQAFLNGVEKGRREVARREKREKKKGNGNGNGNRQDGINAAGGGDPDANTTQGGTTSTSHFEAQPSTSIPPTNPKPRPEMRFRQHALAPTARTPIPTRDGEGDSKGTVNRVLRQIF